MEAEDLVEPERREGPLEGLARFEVMALDHVTGEMFLEAGVWRWRRANIAERWTP